MIGKKENIELENTKRVEAWDYFKKKRRWAFFWGFLVAFILSCVIFSASEFESYPSAKPHIAHIKINGVIFQDDYRDEMLSEIANRKDVRALVVEINSPGGAIYPSEALFEQIRALDEAVPRVSLMRDIAASGGYITALATDHIVAGRTTVTGSVGVIMDIPNVSDLLDNIGIETTVIRSSEAKGGISPLRDPTPEEIENESQLIAAMYDWFRGIVAERRGLAGNALNAVTQGTAFTGQEALANGLIDEIGGMEQALDYLYAQDAALEDLDVQIWEPLYPETSPQAYVKTLAREGLEQAQAALLEASLPSFQAILR